MSLFRRRYLILLMAMVLVTIAASALMSIPAQAATPTSRALSRSVAAIKAYKSEPKDITVNIADLKLSASQIQSVIDDVKYDGRYFWVDANLSVPNGTSTIIYHCVYSDSSITAMQKKLATRAKDALSCITKKMTSAQKVHALHDWLIRQADYSSSTVFKNQSAYGTLVSGGGNCMGFTLGMRVLLRKAGFTTSIAINKSIAHAWNMVKFGGYWYHVDVTWDNGYTGHYFWPNSICHKYFLISDSGMALDTHKGWTASHKATSTKYEGANWEKSCSGSLSVGKKFTRGGFTYKVTSSLKVEITACSKKTSASITVLKTVLYKGFDYKVTKIAKKSFSKCSKATTLEIKSTYLTKRGVRSSLRGSRIKVVDVPASKYTSYRACFTKANCGRRVTVRK